MRIVGAKGGKLICDIPQDLYSRIFGIASVKLHTI